MLKFQSFRRVYSGLLLSESLLPNFAFTGERFTVYDQLNLVQNRTYFDVRWRDAIVKEGIQANAKCFQVESAGGGIDTHRKARINGQVSLYL